MTQAATQVPDDESRASLGQIAWLFLKLGSIAFGGPAAYDLILRLEKAGAHIYVPRGDLDYAIGVGLRMLLLRRIVVEQDGLYHASPEETALLAYYANAIEPLVAAAGGSQPAAPVPHAA